MANLSKIVKLTQNQYDILQESGSITIEGITYSLDPNALYLIPDESTYVLSVNNTLPDENGNVNISLPPLTNVAYTNVDNNFSTTQTITGSDDTPLNLRANNSNWANIALFNSNGSRLGNIGANGYNPYWWGGQGNNGQIALISDLSSKQDTLISGTNIKTINNESILGSGNISISAPTYSAGNGINISNDTISVDSEVVAMKSDLDITFNDSTTSVTSTETLNNIVAGDKKYDLGEQVTYNYSNGVLTITTK